jgi:hypothetical protein
MAVLKGDVPVARWIEIDVHDEPTHLSLLLRGIISGIREIVMWHGGVPSLVGLLLCSCAVPSASVRSQAPTTAAQQESSVVRDSTNQSSTLNPRYSPAATADDCTGTNSLEFVGFESELHAKCDDEAQIVRDYWIKEKGAEAGEKFWRMWNCWHGFPDRWELCRKMEQIDCKGDEARFEQWSAKAMACRRSKQACAGLKPNLSSRPTHSGDYITPIDPPSVPADVRAAAAAAIRETQRCEKDCSGLDLAARISAPDVDACRTVHELDDLMQRFEKTAQESEHEQSELVRQLLQNRTVPTVPVSQWSVHMGGGNPVQTRCVRVGNVVNCQTQ